VDRADDRSALDELRERRALTEDAARPEAVERRHAAGGRTARENVEDLVDDGSFVEYGRFAIAAQRGRRDLDDVIDPAETRAVIARTLAAAPATPLTPPRRFVDTW
jgi:acetyl-CoA carboxylase carboxyltransferase component